MFFYGAIVSFLLILVGFIIILDVATNGGITMRQHTVEQCVKLNHLAINLMYSGIAIGFVTILIRVLTN